MFHALFTAFLLWLTLLLPGWAWLWVVPDLVRPQTPRVIRWLHAGSGVVLLGVLLTSLSTLVLGELGWFSPLGEWWLRGTLVVIGIGWGLCRGPSRFGRLFSSALPLSAVLLVGILVIMLLPRRGEWIVGGWDPGVYAGAAVALSRSGTSYPPDTFFYDQLGKAHQAAFTRTGQGRTERFPAVLVHPERSSFTFEFFRLTPSYFAAVHRSGGMVATTRANTILTLLLLPCFLALMIKHFTLAHALFSTLLLALQPILIYHTHWPLTEPLQLFMICGLLFFAVGPTALSGGMFPAGLFLLAAVLNRYSFLPFAGVFLVCLALGDALSEDRRAVWLRKTLFLCLCAAGVWINYRIAPASLRGWSDIGLINTFAIVALSCSLLVDAVCSLRFVRERIRRVKPAQWTAVAVLFLVALPTTWLLRGYIGRASDMTNLQRLAPYIGWTPLLLAGAGLLAMLLPRPRIKVPVLLSLCLFLFSVAWLMVLRKSIVDWFPWATRRYLPHFVPFVAISAGYALSRLWTWRFARHWSKTLAVALVIITVIELQSVCRRAWTYTAYNGAAERFQQIADQMDANDVVIADHPAWGTPLALVYGKPVLNGREVWMDETGNRMRVMQKAIARLIEQGRSVRLLTSTERGPELYPDSELATVLDWEAPEWTYQEIIQHPHAANYELRTCSVVFRLYSVHVK